MFDDVRQFGLKYGVLPLVARATSMSGGFHLSAFDYEGAEALQLQARELARSVNFAPSVVSGGIDLLLCVRAGTNPDAPRRSCAKRKHSP